jgi:hypothetical protein
VHVLVFTARQLKMLGAGLAEPEIFHVPDGAGVEGELKDPSAHVAERLRTRGAVVQHMRLDDCCLQKVLF